MLDAALKLIQDTAKQAQAARRLDAADPRHAHYQMGDRIITLDIPPPPREHHDNTLADLIQYTERATDQGLCTVLWHTHNAVILLLDDADRRDRVTFALDEHPQFAALKAMAAAAGCFTGPEFVRFLRLAMCFPDLATIQKFRRLDWRRSEATITETTRQRESLGREIMAEVTGIDELPDALTFQVPAYSNPGETEPWMIRCLLDYDTANQRIRLAPMPGEIDLAIAAAQASIRNRLTDALTDTEGVCLPIYFGTP
jgi:hypothetical protein